MSRIDLGLIAWKLEVPVRLKNVIKRLYSTTFFVIVISRSCNKTIQGEDDYPNLKC